MSALFAHATLSDTLVYETLRHLPYIKSKVMDRQKEREKILTTVENTKVGQIPKGRADNTRLASVAQLDAPSNWRPGGHGFNPHRGR